jgi:ribose transport system permease protein
MYIGKYIRALGSNGKELMLQAGIDVNAITIISYILGSVFFAVASMILVARQGMVNGETSNLEYGILCIGAVYIGGISPNNFSQADHNHSASVIHAIAGAFVVAIISNGVQIAELEEFWEYIILSLVLLTTIMARNIEKFVARNRSQIKL